MLPFVPLTALAAMRTCGWCPRAMSWLYFGGMTSTMSVRLFSISFSAASYDGCSPLKMKYLLCSMLCTRRWLRLERSLSTILTRMFFTSWFITHGITHIIMMGKTNISRGKKALRRICRNSFWMRYFIIGFGLRFFCYLFQSSLKLCECDC